MRGPLTGIKVVDLSAVVSGPLTAALLADQGADVIKVERIGAGDIQRSVGSRRNGFSGSFHVMNRGKRSIALDLQKEPAQKIVQRLTQDADVVIQNFRPGVVDRLNIGYENINELNPGIVYLSISGFGPNGPRSSRRAYDPIIQSYSGVAHIQGSSKPHGPEQVNQLLMDKLTAYTGCQAITAALFARHTSNLGQHIELSMLDTAIAFIWPDAGADSILQGEDIEHRRAIRAAGFVAEYQDGWGAMMILSDSEFEGLCHALNLDELIQDERFNTLEERHRNHQAFEAILTGSVGALLKKMPLSEASRILDEHHVPFTHIRSIEELPADPQIVANEMFVDTSHPVAGKMREARPAPVFSKTPVTVAGPAPVVGEHTNEILAEIGMADLVDEMVEQRIVGIADMPV
jgi:crotonobetainyl-CoA:carnitine CoA-transferase CaiB-like acyl-CoA transferase